MKLRNISFEIELTVAGYLMNFDVIPFRWAALDFRDSPISRWSNETGWHLFAGPLHVWTSSGFSAPFSIALKVGQNPFHGGKLIPRETKP